MFRKHRRSQKDFNAEVQAHLECEAQRLVSEGLSEQEAEAAARRAFGNVLAAQERFYESRRTLWLHDLVNDLRYAARSIRRSPGYALAVGAVLSGAIGSVVAIYAFVDAILLCRLPYEHVERLIMIWETNQDAPPRSSTTPAWVDPRQSWVSAPNAPAIISQIACFAATAPVAIVQTTLVTIRESLP